MVPFAVVLGGLAIGSFLNVVIARLPEARSLWKPRSACPACGATIAWYDNIPIASFLLLRGRCRACAGPISWRYPLVEGATAALFSLAYARFGPTADFLAAAVLLAMLIAITAIDLGQQIIPHAITVPGICIGVLASLLTRRISWLESILGIVIGGGLFLVIIQVSSWLLRAEGMGGGDMMLAAMLGAFLGWKIALLSFFAAVVLGGAFAVVLLASGRSGRRDPIPFGPFLALGGVIGLFWGERLLAWYLGGPGR